MLKSTRLLCAALCAVLAACSNSGSSSSSASSAPASSSATGGKTIGVSIQNREAQFYQSMESGMKAEAAKYGYSLVVVDANRDNAKQQSQVEDFISSKVDAIVLTPYDSTAIGSAIVEANKANIPVFTADIASTSKQGIVVAHVASDNVQGGMQAAKLICKAVGSSGTVAILDERGERAKADSSMGDVLQSNPNVKGVFGINDDSALGAVSAIKAAGAAGKIAVVGYDATPEAQAAIKAGTMYGDAIQYPDKIGALTIDTIHDYLTGKTPPKVVHVPVGTYTR